MEWDFPPRMKQQAFRPPAFPGILQRNKLTLSKEIKDLVMSDFFPRIYTDYPYPTAGLDEAQCMKHGKMLVTPQQLFPLYRAKVPSESL